MALGYSAGAGIQVKVWVPCQIHKPPVEMGCPGDRYFVLRQYRPFAGCKASAAHIRIGFDNRHFKLGIAQQISRTETGDTGAKYNDMLSLADALIELRRSGIGPSPAATIPSSPIP